MEILRNNTISLQFFCHYLVDAHLCGSTKTYNVHFIFGEIMNQLSLSKCVLLEPNLIQIGKRTRGMSKTLEIKPNLAKTLNKFFLSFFRALYLYISNVHKKIYYVSSQHYTFR